MPAPIEWTPDLVERICSDLSSGRAIREVAAEEWCPSEPSIYRRMASDADFSDQIAKARAAQQDHEIEECVRMADEATPEDWQVVKLRIWSRQWRAAKLAPKKYGDRQSIDLGGQPDNPLRTESTAVTFDPMTLPPEDREALMRILHRDLQTGGS